MDNIIQRIRKHDLDPPANFSPKIIATRIKSRLAKNLLYNESVADRNPMETLTLELAVKAEKHTKELSGPHCEVIIRQGINVGFFESESNLHIIRVGRSCHLIAQKIGLAARDCEMILQASAMHDVGKIGIPDKVLLKPGKLDHEERQIMKSHTTIGGEILSGRNSEMLKLAEIIARTHHEKFDGSGYPKGLKGEEIPVASQIVALCDGFDALTSTRPYKKAWSAEETVNHINNKSGRHFNPKLVPVFNQCLAELLQLGKEFAD
jgi:putative two-component system response regulator